jgi:hypothetical protein
MSLCERLRDVQAHPRSTSADELKQLLEDAGFVYESSGGGMAVYTHHLLPLPVNTPDYDPVYAGSATPVARAIEQVVDCDDD